MKRPEFSVSDILAWADAHHARTGKWPKYTSGPIVEMLGANWKQVDNALRYGLRGLSGGSSLAQLLQQERGVRNIKNLPPLTEEQILRWADQHHTRTGRWPNEDAGPVLGASPGENWRNIEANLRDGNRGLPGGSTLPRLLAQRRAVPNRLEAHRLTIEQILTWADLYHERTGRWPRVKSGPVLGAEGLTWGAIESALNRGFRGLPAGTSLAKVLAEHRGVRNKADLPRLTEAQVVAWMQAHFYQFGEWPNGSSGPVAEAPGETWRGVEAVLYQGLRGLPGGMTLARLRRKAATERGEKPSR